MKDSPLILVVDDDEAVRVSLNVHLEDSGYSVVPASSAEESLDKMEQHPIDIALVDLRLPAMNGVDLIREAHSRWPDMGFIIHTGSVEYDLADDIKELPQVSKNILIKPVADLTIICEEISNLQDSLTKES